MHNSFGEAESIRRTKCIQQHLQDYPLVRSGRCRKGVRETTTLFIAAQLNYSLALSSWQKEEGGAFNWRNQ